MIYKSLAHLQNKATGLDLKESYEIEMEERLRQQHRIEIIFNILKESTKGSADDVILAMTSSQKKLTKEASDNSHMDAMMIVTSHALATAQVHGYETTINCAEGVINPEITRLLRRALREEKDIEKRLAALEELYKEAINGKKLYEEACEFH
ncbi:hypothetical protein C900_00179 [Fulvivirga imtechensis AK7]|uniref:Uncharacterized protein n=1 Tax=Fulvivirga imtechensis AK7 TaxID=1237149 RepID=L8JII1_9BACT|nr:hypothetical protein C900_00179 [Fulvivirga imtechensis AK7]